MVGSQWFFGVNNNWVIDAWFAGAHYGKGSGDVLGRTDVTLTPKMQQDLQNELDQLDIPVISFDWTEIGESNNQQSLYNNGILSEVN